MAKVPSLVKRPLDFLLNSSDRYIGTHNGKFHCDEVFACWMLKQLPAFREHVILREFTETMATLACTLVDGKLQSRKSLQYNTKLSSAGLIYAFYGQDVIRNVLNNEKLKDYNEETIDLYYDRLYKHFVESIDAIDNGIKSHDEPPKYMIPVSLQSLVEDLNPCWNDDKVSEDVQFEKAMELVGNIFKEKLLYIHRSWMPARNIVEEAVKNREKIHSSGKVILLEKSCPWKQHFFIIEEELGIGGQIVFALFSGDKEGSNWRIQSIPLSESAQFENRWPLPADWRGLRDQKLAAAIEVPSAMFVHANGFIGGAKTKEDVLKMADKALKLPRKP